MFKKITYSFLLLLFLSSCGDSWDSLKRGLTGAKKKSADEFLIKKKDPLVLPPDFESLPTPDERVEAQQDISNIEEKLKKNTEDGSTESSDTSVEQSILKQIQKN